MSAPVKVSNPPVKIGAKPPVKTTSAPPIKTAPPTPTDDDLKEDDEFADDEAAATANEDGVVSEEANEFDDDLEAPLVNAANKTVAPTVQPKTAAITKAANGGQNTASISPGVYLSDLVARLEALEVKVEALETKPTRTRAPREGAPAPTVSAMEKILQKHPVSEKLAEVILGMVPAEGGSVAEFQQAIKDRLAKNKTPISVNPAAITALLVVNGHSWDMKTIRPADNE